MGVKLWRSFGYLCIAGVFVFLGGLVVVRGIEVLAGAGLDEGVLVWMCVFVVIHYVSAGLFRLWGSDG